MAEREDLPVTPPPPMMSGDLEFDPGAGFSAQKAERGLVNGEKAYIQSLDQFHAGYLLPADDKSYVWIGANTPVGMPHGPNEDARELRLKVRELASQLFDNGENGDLSGMVALPSSFVHQDDFQQSSSFGRYLAEQLFYECNQRGFPVREYRATSSLHLRPQQGEFVLTRELGTLHVGSSSAVLLTGTYYFDQANVYVNARLIKADTGMVLRTAHLTFPQTFVTQKMLTQPTLTLSQAYVGIQDYSTMTESTTLSDIDLGYDVR